MISHPWLGFAAFITKMMHLLQLVSSWTWLQSNIMPKYLDECLMEGESTSPKHLMTCSRSKGFTFSKVHPTHHNKIVTLNASCILLWTNQKLCGMIPAFLIVGGNSPPPMQPISTIVHRCIAITGVPPMRCLTKSNQTYIAHLCIFGCATYVHLHENVWAKKIAPT